MLPPNYWYYRSGRNIDFFSVGFFSAKRLLIGRDPNCGEIPTKNYLPALQEFSEDDFKDCVNYFETISTWKHDGGTELLLMQSSYNPETKAEVIDTSSLVGITLEDAINLKLIKGLSNLVEDLLKFARYFERLSPTGELDDRTSLMRFVLLLLPENQRDITDAVRFY